LIKGDLMEISARNQLNGKITDVQLGAVMANIKIEITGPNVITAVITKESAEKLGLTEGDDVCAIIKSTEVIVGK
jgi:molybdopterin-binding protein